jgi:hypothetical protein
MALSMDEQRILAEIERRLAAEDPGLAARMSAFKRPSPVNVFKSARARLIGSLLTVVVVAMVSLMAYAMLPFRSNVSRAPAGHPAATRGQPVMTVASAGTGRAKTGTARTPAGKTTGSAAAKTSGTTTHQKSSAHGKASTSHTGGTPSAAANAKPASSALNDP